MQLDDLKEKTTDLADHAEDLANTFYRLTVVNLTQKTSNIGSGLILGILLGILSFFVLLFLGVALSLWLGDLLENRTAGFLLGAAFFTVLLLVIAMLKKQIISFFRNLIVRKIYE